MIVIFRSYQFVLRIASYFQKFRTPIILSGENVHTDIANVLRSKKTVFIVTDKTLGDL